MKNSEITVEQIRKRVRTETEDLTIPNSVRDYLESFEGKQITRRIATKLEKDLPEFRVHYSNYSGSFHPSLNVWERDRRFEDRYEFYLGKSGQRKFSLSVYLECNRRYYSAAEARNDWRNGLLMDDAKAGALADQLNTYKEAAFLIRQLHDQIPTEFRDLLPVLPGRERR